MILLNGNPINITMFPDKTSQVWKLPEEILNETNFALVTWKFENEGEFLHLAQLKDLLDRHSISVTLKLPYLPYARQDKDIDNNLTFALNTFAKLINVLEFEEVLISDPHSKMSKLIKDSYSYYPIDKVNDLISNNKIDVLCYPDAGALHKYSSMYNHPYVHGIKVRNQLTGNIDSYTLIGDVKDKNVLIIDDICDGGMTFKLLTKDLLQSGAKSVMLFVTHGIFSKGIETLKESGIKSIHTEKESYL